MRVSYTDAYYVPLPDGHPFPMGKFPALRDLLLEEGLVREHDIVSPRQADWSDLLLVHTPRYLNALAEGTLSRQEERRMGLPWSDALVRRSRHAVQGTINACSMALEDGIAANLAGGTHHAFPDHGEGFCVLNDVAVAIRVLKRARWIRRAMVIDLDVHQGNGTAAIFREDPDVFTLSVHGEKNYPFRKEPSTLDVGLPDGADDDAYMAALQDVLPKALDGFPCDLVIYLGGIDVLSGDRFGRLALTRHGLARRDRFVIEQVTERGRALTCLLSGGYAATPELTADCHASVHRQAALATA
ncbi:MAG: histone deacetylase [Rhodothermales bacterium]|nr:histone deacetylase [Rhodothermales bacterium]MBO6778098.1 histone deacetylase [Rhodothermales bacterium]